MSFKYALGEGRETAGIVTFNHPECGGEVKAILNGPFTEAMRRNVEDFIQSDGTAFLQWTTGRSLNTDVGLKTTEIEKRQWSLNVVLIDILGLGDPVQNFRKLEAMVSYSNIGLVSNTVGNPISVTVGNPGNLWFKNNRVWLIEARGEWSPSVSTNGKPLYISAEVTFQEDIAKSCVQIINGE